MPWYAVPPTAFWMSIGPGSRFGLSFGSRYSASRLALGSRPSRGTEAPAFRNMSMMGSSVFGSKPFFASCAFALS